MTRGNNVEESGEILLSVVNQRVSDIPVITHRPVNTRVTRGHKIVLDCFSPGQIPPPEYAWYKDGGRLSDAHDRYHNHDLNHEKDKWIKI